MSRIVLPMELMDRLRQFLFKDTNESAAVLIGRAVVVDHSLTRIVVREIVEPNAEDFDVRTPLNVQLNPSFVGSLSQRIRETGESLIFVHTHPFDLNEFSSRDNAGEQTLANFFEKRTPDIVHASLLLTPTRSIARILGTQNYLKVIVAGSNFFLNIPSKISPNSSLYDRQIRAFGKEGQTMLGSLRIAIVGLGGTGSVVAQQLAHLGIKDFFLIDPDTLEESNLNRVVGASKKDVGHPKVTIARQFIQDINPDAEVEILQDSVLRNTIALTLTNTDFVFACTDSHGSRAVLNQLAYQYLLPIIDMGVVINVLESKVEHVAARTQLLAPGLACMVCSNLLDYEEVRRDLLTDFERKQDPYILNEAEPAPAVISLNSTIASMAITMFLNCAVGVPGTARFINYNAMTGTSRPVVCTTHPSCIVCSRTGSFGRANEWSLPGRKD